MPVVASLTLPKVRINPGSRTFGPHAAPAVPLTGLVFTSQRNTSARPSRRGDTADTIYRIVIEGQRVVGGSWGMLMQHHMAGGVYRMRSKLITRALRSMTPAQRLALRDRTRDELLDLLRDYAEDLDGDRVEVALAAPTRFVRLRATIIVTGAAFGGSATLELLGA